jgi:hypothetical protein
MKQEHHDCGKEYARVSRRTRPVKETFIEEAVGTSDLDASPKHSYGVEMYGIER